MRTECVCNLHCITACHFPLQLIIHIMYWFSHYDRSCTDIVIFRLIMYWYIMIYVRSCIDRYSHNIWLWSKVDHNHHSLILPSLMVCMCVCVCVCVCVHVRVWQGRVAIWSRYRIWSRYPLNLTQLSLLFKICSVSLYSITLSDESVFFMLCCDISLPVASRHLHYGQSL